MASEIVFRAVLAVEEADRHAAMAGNKRWRRKRQKPVPAPPPTSFIGQRALQERDAARPCVVIVKPDILEMLANHTAE